MALPFEDRYKLSVRSMGVIHELIGHAHGRARSEGAPADDGKVKRELLVNGALAYVLSLPWDELVERVNEGVAILRDAATRAPAGPAPPGDPGRRYAEVAAGPGEPRPGEGREQKKGPGRRVRRLGPRKGWTPKRKG